MTLKELIEELQEIVKESPDAADRVVIMSRDPEGNGYSEYYGYGFQKYDETDGEVYPDGSDEDSEEDEDEWEAPEDAVPAIVLWPS